MGFAESVGNYGFRRPQGQIPRDKHLVCGRILATGTIFRDKDGVGGLSAGSLPTNWGPRPEPDDVDSKEGGSTYIHRNRLAGEMRKCCDIHT